MIVASHEIALVLPVKSQTYHEKWQKVSRGCCELESRQLASCPAVFRRRCSLRLIILILTGVKLVVQLLRRVRLFCGLMDCSPPRSSFLGISQARVLEWVAISFFRGLPNPGIKPISPAGQADSFYHSAMRETLWYSWESPLQNLRVLTGSVLQALLTLGNTLVIWLDCSFVTFQRVKSPKRKESHVLKVHIYVLVHFVKSIRFSSETLLKDS